MKKAYISPNLYLKEVKTLTILAGSITGDTDTSFGSNDDTDKPGEGSFGDAKLYGNGSNVWED